MSDIRYNNEFCVVRENGTNELVLSELLSGRVGTLQQIEKHTGLSTINPDYFPNLPETGWIELGMYNYNASVVMCVQAHSRTIYPPEQTPALFSFSRPNNDDLEWIPNELVQVGYKRWYNDKQYECIQAHMTLEGWTPDVTPALWQEVIATPDYPVWQQPTGAHDAYQIGDRVHFPTINDPVYESLINANVWSPLTYPAGWQLIDE